MGQSIVKICISTLACLVIASMGFAADQGAPAYGGSSTPPKVKHAKSHDSKSQEKITLGIGGAEDKRSAEMLTSALNANGLKGSVREGKGKSSEMTTWAEPTSDLSAIAKAVAEVATPQKMTSPPTLSVVVFAPLTKETEEKIMEKLATVPGVDVKNTKADVEKGELWVRISGDAKVTTTDISTAIQSAGVTAQMTKGGKGKQT
jgi:hypothetical protein